MLKLEIRQLKKQRLQIAFRDFWSFLVSIAEQYLRKTGFVQFKKPTKMILRSLWKTYAHKSQKLRTIVQKWSDLEFNLFHSFMETWVRAFLFCLFVCNMHLIFLDIDLETTCIWKFCFVKFVFAWSMFVYTLLCIYVLG